MARRRPTGDRGSIPMTLALLIVITGVVAALVATALTAAVKAKTTAASRQVSLLSASVVDDYVNMLATSPTGFVVTQAGTFAQLTALQRTGMPNGTAVSAPGQVAWVMSPDPGNAQSGTLTVDARWGVATQSTTVRVQAMSDVRWVSSDENDRPAVLVRTPVASQYALFGERINVTPGPGSSAQTAVDGNIGILSTTGWLSTTLRPTGHTFNYSGTDLADPSVINSNLRMSMDLSPTPSCGAGTGYLTSDWASTGALSPAVGQKYRCANKVTINQNTMLTGGVTTFYANEVTIGANITNADGKSAVNFVSPTGDLKVTFTDNVTAESVHLYSPRGSCRTALNKSITLRGSVACKEIEMTGRFTWSALPQNDANVSTPPLFTHETISETRGYSDQETP